MVLIVVVGSRCSGKSYFCEHHLHELGLTFESLKVIDLAGVAKILQMRAIFHADMGAEKLDPCGEATRHTMVLTECVQQLAPDIRSMVKLFVFCEPMAMKKTLDLMHVVIPRQYNEAARDCFVVFNRTSEDFSLIPRTWPKSWTQSGVGVEISGITFFDL